MDIDETELAYLNDMRMLSTDEHGQRIFVGLTLVESEEYYTLVSKGHSDRDGGDGDRYLELCAKHERARFQVLGAENELRGNPTRN